MSFIRNLKGDKPQVMKVEAFCQLLKFRLPSSDKAIAELFGEFDKLVNQENKQVTSSAMSNAHGDWYEWLLGITAWNYSVKNDKANIALLTPNISQFNVGRLYVDRLYGLIQDLRKKVQDSASVQLISSNPDFVIISRKLAKKLKFPLTEITKLNPEVIETLESAYKLFINQCDFNDILGYVSVKTSLRPDRRLQISHEGSLVKAIYTHLQTREWIINPPGIRYFAISTKLNAADKQALRTVATHSITSVHSLPQAAVDGVFEANSLSHAELAFSQILA